ncbi:MAG: hypothetical protein JW913_15565 [Chitinispirillaceae bacterium]|nr:hypothetical protein [Chitinispirillaceae bacterium]
MNAGRGKRRNRMNRFTISIFALVILCSPPGRVLHVDNKKTIPYTAEDGRLKQRVVRSLVKHRLITASQKLSCQVNIMQLGQRYMVEVWPDGISSECRFGVKLKKPMLVPVERYIDCRDKVKTGTAAGASLDSPEK